MDDLFSNISVETNRLHSVLANLVELEWETPTKSTPWNVKDQISHLAANDDNTVLALTDPVRFVSARPSTLPDIQKMVDQVIINNHDRSGQDLFRWFIESRHLLIKSSRNISPKQRIPWYGSEMSVASALTARLMETWAHGYDIFEALKMPYVPTNALRHVVFLGLQALPSSFSTNGLEAPKSVVQIKSKSPSGDIWQFGPSDASNVIYGDAFELALVVTQRIHVDDTGIRSIGPVADQWIHIAQAFAGPPGSGRREKVTRGLE